MKFERVWTLVLEHLNRLRFVPMMLGRKNAGSKHIQKSVHLGFHFIAKLPDRMMQAGGEFDRDVMFCRRENRARDLDRARKGISRYAPGPKFVTKRRLFRSRDQCDRLFG